MSAIKNNGDIRFEEKEVEFQNDDPQGNIIAVKLPEDFLKKLNAKGYELEVDRSGYTKIKISYDISNQEVDKFISDFQFVYELYSSKEPSSRVKSQFTSALQEKSKEREA